MVVRLNESMDVVAKEEEIYISDEDSSSYSSNESSSTNAQSATTMQPKRKRQRLTHLTPEEKTLRRKMKNRVAAQSARDRKKAHMDTLEEQVAKLSEQNEKLKLENSLLKEKARLLSNENQSLKQKLATSATNAATAVRIDSVGVERSAESSNVTQPKVLLQLTQFNTNSSSSLRGPSDVQSLLQKLVVALLIHLSGLIKAIDSQNSNKNTTRHYQQLVSIRETLIRLDNYMTCHRLSIVKLKQTLIKLLKLYRLIRFSRSTTATTSSSANHQLQLVTKRSQSSSFKTCPGMDEAMRLYMLISFMASLAAKKKKRN